MSIFYQLQFGNRMDLNLSIKIVPCVSAHSSTTGTLDPRPKTLRCARMSGATVLFWTHLWSSETVRPMCPFSICPLSARCWLMWIWIRVFLGTGHIILHHPHICAVPECQVQRSKSGLTNGLQKPCAAR